MKRYFLEFPAVLGSLDLVAEFIRQACKAVPPPGLSDEVIGAIDLVASEAVTNAISHGARFEGDLLTVTVEVSDQSISLQVLDHGPGFDLDAMTQPDLDQPSESGYGIFIIKSLMDEVSYLRGEDSNILIMIKHRGHIT